MGIREWLFARQTGEAHAPGDENVLAVVAPWKANTPLPDNHDYASLCGDGYERNPIIYACVGEIASSIAEPDLLVKRLRGTEEDILGPEDDLVRLLERPNPDQDQFEFLETLLIHMGIAGEAWIHKVRAGSGRVVQLRLLRPDRVEPVVSKTGLVQRYEYKIDGTIVERAIPPADIAPIRRLHPRDDFRGLSPITVAARFADLDNHAGDFLRSTLTNGGIVRGILKLKQKTSAKDRESVRQQWRDKYSGPSGWNDISVLDEDADYQAIGIQPKDADLGNIFGETESRICIAYGVPPILIAAKIGLDRATYSNYETALRAFWQKTLSPIFVRVAARLTHGVASEFGDDRLISWDFSGVEALRESEDARHKRANEGWMAGTLTLNEARMEMGLPRLTDGDVRRSDIGGMLEPAIPEQQRTALDRIDAILTLAERKAAA